LALGVKECPAFASDEADLGMAMVEATKVTGVRKFVFSGVIHPSISKMANHAAKLPVEEAMYESGLDFTVLQPTMFMQTLNNSWSGVLERGQSLALCQAGKRRLWR
jgi:uncharacterized protein YbjT (DUF2867 family)